MIEGVLDIRGIDAAEEVHIEEVFPGLAAKRARLDFGHVEIAEGQSAEGAEKRAGRVAGAEHQRRLPNGVRRLGNTVLAGINRRPQEKEAGEILAVALD